MSKFFRKVLELGVLVSCLMLALTIFHLVVDFTLNKQLAPSRFYVIWAICFSTFFLAICFSIKEKWKTIVILSAIVLMILFILIASVGIQLIVKNLFESPSIYNLGLSGAFLIVGGSLSWVTYKLLKSKKLN